MSQRGVNNRIRHIKRLHQHQMIRREQLQVLLKQLLKSVKMLPGNDIVKHKVSSVFVHCLASKKHSQ
jgi:hypothetical protein